MTGTDRLAAFARRLSALKGDSVKAAASDAYPGATANLLFSGGARVRADYWRLIKDGKARLSSFDDEQRYGLPAPIQAVAQLAGKLSGNRVLDARVDAVTGDLVFDCSDGVSLQALNFTGYEVWEITFADGTREFSNHVLGRSLPH